MFRQMKEGQHCAVWWLQGERNFKWALFYTGVTCCYCALDCLVECLLMMADSLASVPFFITISTKSKINPGTKTASWNAFTYDAFSSLEMKPSEFSHFSSVLLGSRQHGNNAQVQAKQPVMPFPFTFVLRKWNACSVGVRWLHIATVKQHKKNIGMFSKYVSGHCPSSLWSAVQIEQII